MLRNLSMVFAMALFLISQANAQQGDAAAGAKVFKKCAACHNAVEAQNKVGPHLVGIINRPIGSVEDYEYSSAMMAFGEEGAAWDEALLRDYLIAPRAMVKGTKMTFAGIRKPKDLDNLLAYLVSIAATK